MKRNNSEAVLACLAPPAPTRPAFTPSNSRSGTPVPQGTTTPVRRSLRASPHRSEHSIQRPYATALDSSVCSRESSVSRTWRKHASDYTSTASSHHRGIIFPTDAAGSPQNIQECSGRRLWAGKNAANLSVRRSLSQSTTQQSQRGRITHPYSDSLAGARTSVVAEQHQMKMAKYCSPSRGTTPVPWGSDEPTSSSRYNSVNRGRTPVRGQSPYRHNDTLNIFGSRTQTPTRCVSPMDRSRYRQHFCQSYDSINVGRPTGSAKEVEFKPSLKVMSGPPPFQPAPLVRTTPLKGRRAISPAATQAGGHNFVNQGTCVTASCTPSGKRATLEAMRAAAPAPRNAPLPM